MLTLEDRLAARVKHPTTRNGGTKVHAVNGCARPIRLAGAHQLQDATTGTVLHHHGGDIFAPCGNRRSAVCPSCSDRYAADAFHLIRAGLVGGTRASRRPSPTGPARSSPSPPRPSARPPPRGPPTGASGSRAACGEYHHDDDTRIGTPLDPETYDYVGSVLWQAHAGVLWQRFTTRLRREIAKRAGLKAREFAEQARLSYGKVAEYQRRGLVHFHAVVRLDGPDGARHRLPGGRTRTCSKTPSTPLLGPCS